MQRGPRIEPAGSGSNIDKESTPTRPSVVEQEQPPLPEGWFEKKDAVTGKSFYYNKETKQTTWARPRVEQGPPLPENWKEKYDRSTGKFFYYNKATGETTWMRPQAAAATAVDPSSQDNSSFRPGTELSDEPASSD